MSTALSVRIADALIKGLPATLDTLSTERYGGPLPVRLLPDAPDTQVRLALPDLPPLEAVFTSRHAGGNVYDVEARIDGRPVRSFGYCLPDPAPLLMPLPVRLAREVAGFLLDELERRVGRDLIRQQIAALATGFSSPSDENPSAP
jgi:hypothetical protein